MKYNGQLFGVHKSQLYGEVRVEVEVGNEVSRDLRHFLDFHCGYSLTFTYEFSFRICAVVLFKTGPLS
jgi:hypothetical protein